jgi:phosphohistidine phosphatase
MQIFLIRHGEATSPYTNPERPLSGSGREDVEKLAFFLQSQKLKVAEIWHSSKLRARQTAEIVSAVFQLSGKVSQVEGLCPNDPVKNIREKIETDGIDVAIVGHLPFLDKLSSLLLTGEESDSLLSFEAGAAACLEMIRGDGWRLL